MTPLDNFNDSSSSDEELVFTTHGTSVDEVYGGEPEDDVDECEEDDFSDNSWD